ncbi:major allergen Pru av 1-like [Eucalyptus grandis]|uniref:major allergen Pru av 1-like n=1 Tax=Eucalyptus grandis TaxID=71139 RepID=UPI00192EDD44|nr:major allergen Pru av 1-like [Eucalyptus grandis]
MEYFRTEIKSSIPPAQAFEAIVRALNLISRVLLPFLKSVELVEETTGSEGHRNKVVKHKLEVLDGSYSYSNSITESNMLANTLENTSYEVKISASPEGGSVCRSASKYFARGNVDNTEEKIKAVREKAFTMFGAIEACLANPETCESVCG